MISRKILAKLSLLLDEFPAVVIMGPRQVGKTTLAFALGQTRPSLHLDLELPSDRAKLADPELLLGAHPDKLIVLDEVQRAPELFVTLRSIIDQRRRSGRCVGQFLLLGSASGSLLRQSSESLAGRVAYCELPALLASEIPDTSEELDDLWLRGGFPQSYLSRSDAASLRWRRQFISTYLERDIPMLGPRIPAETLRRYWTMLAHEQGQIHNAARLAASLALSGQTVARYLDLMTDLMLVRRLTPWASNVGKRLVRSPKVYIRDSGLAHALLNLPTREDVLAHPVAGGSWEGMVIENLIAAAPDDAQAYYYRSIAGAEIDLLLELPGGQRWAVEIKRSSAPVTSRGLHIAAADVQATRKLVVSAARSTFALNADTQNRPLPALMDELMALT